jgi:Protein of unknown function (DUF4058)
MPIHDWGRVDAGIFHHFHHGWIEEIARALNRGLLPPEYYALAEQVAGGLIPDVLTLERPDRSPLPSGDPSGGVAVAAVPPRVQFRCRSEQDVYAAKAKSVTIRHTSNHKVVAMVEIVSPGNKSSTQGLRDFVRKAVEFLRGGIHLLILDLFPPSPRDPIGLPKVILAELFEAEYALVPNRPLTLASYVAGRQPEAFIEPTAVGAALIEMPLFLVPEVYVPVPLEATYQAAWDAVPAFWREVIAR